MVSDFKKKKLLYVYKTFFDSKNSGLVNKHDFDNSLKTVAKLQGWNLDELRHKNAQEAMVKIWQGLSIAADKDNDGNITEEEWITMWDAQDKDSMSEWQQLYCKNTFNIQDAAGDGAIDEKEFVDVHVKFGMPKEVATESYQKLSEGKSSISWEEFQIRFQEYFFSDDVNVPGNYLFGPNK